MDFEALASQLVRALRGRRSQAALSRRLGYRSNVLYIWEAGTNFPTAAKAFRLMARVGIDPNAALVGFYRRPPAWLVSVDLTKPDGVVQLLNDLRGKASIITLSAATKRDRFAVARWLKGSTEPRLPDFLRLVQACSLRLLDFVAAFVDPADLAEVAQPWKTLQTARRAAYEQPWSHAVLRALELEEYRRLPAHVPGWIASRLGLPLDVEQRSLSLLAETGQIHLHDGRWCIGAALTVDTRHDPIAARNLAAWWASVGAERLSAGSRGNFAYNLFGVSDKDLERLRALQRTYFSELRAIVADSEPVEHVVLANMQLLAIEPERHD